VSKQIRMKVEIGDRVRFLNEVGGGIVTRLEGSLVFVEDDDGFEVPSPVFEIVVVERRSDMEMDSEPEPASVMDKKHVISHNEPVSEKEAFHADLEEEGQDEFNPRFYLSFIKTGKQLDETGTLELFLINDSNYYCSYLISELKEDGYMYALHQGTIQPNTKMPVEEKSVQELDVTWDFQLILYKKGKPFPSLKPVSTSVSIKARKFFRENSFTANDFFYQPAVLIPIIKNELEKKLELLTHKEMQGVISKKETSTLKKSTVKRSSTPELLETDLHIHELLDNWENLSNSEILQIQIDRFHAVMESNLQNKGRKLVFIHGVGNGTLKTEIRKQMERKYKGIYFQDASFREYGYGATMVIIK
jgi:hypothetical protein